MAQDPQAELKPLLCRHLSILGRVQGVGYRWSLSTQAISLELTGWVRNRRDGSVEALICGTPEAVEALTAWSRQGPPSARVERIIYTDTPAAECPEIAATFEQRQTY